MSKFQNVPHAWTHIVFVSTTWSIHYHDLSCYSLWHQALYLFLLIIILKDIEMTMAFPLLYKYLYSVDILFDKLGLIFAKELSCCMAMSFLSNVWFDCISQRAKQSTNAMFSVCYMPQEMFISPSTRMEWPLRILGYGKCIKPIIEHKKNMCG